MSEELSEAERIELASLMGNYGASIPEGKQNVHTFLHNVAVANDTTKLGNLKDEEIGTLENPIRSFKFLALFAEKVMKKDELKNFFNARSEIGTSTSLSRGGFLTKLAVVQRRELADVTKPEVKPNKGWFGTGKDKEVKDNES
jgi:hypothetical protein